MYLRLENVHIFKNNPVAKGEGLVSDKKLSNSLNNFKGYIYKINFFTKLHLILRYFGQFHGQV